MKKIKPKIKLLFTLLFLVPFTIVADDAMKMENKGCSIYFLNGSVKIYKIKDLQKCEKSFVFKETKAGLEFERTVENLLQKTPLDPTAKKSEADAKLLTVVTENAYNFYVKEKWSGRLFAGVESYYFDSSHLVKVEGEYFISLRLLSEILKSNVTVSDNSFVLNPHSEVTVVSVTYTVPDVEIPEPVIKDPVMPEAKPICETNHITVGSDCPSYMANNEKYDVCNLSCRPVASKKEEIIGRVYDIYNSSDVNEIKSTYTHPKYPSSSTNWDEFIPWLQKTNKSSNYYYALMRYVPMTGPNCTGNEVIADETFGTTMFGAELAGENPYGRPTHEDMFSRGFTCSERYVWVVK